MTQYAEIATQLAEAFRRILPPPQQKNKSKTKVGNVPELLQRFYAEARGVRERYRLGVYGRARVAFELQRQLLAEGYAPELCRQILFALILSAFVGSR